MLCKVQIFTYKQTQISKAVGVAPVGLADVICFCTQIQILYLCKLVLRKPVKSTKDLTS